MAAMPYFRHIIIVAAVMLPLSVGDILAEPIQMADNLGRIVRLSAPAQRIVSLSPHLTEMMHSAGAGEHLIAVSKHCDYPPEVKQLPQISDYQSINYEKIARLKPDLILVWNAGLRAGQLGLLEKIAPQSVYVSEIPTLASIANALVQIGKLVGSEDLARQRADIFLKRLKRLQEERQYDNQIPVTWLFWHQPPMAAGGTHWIDEAIQICGGINAYGKIENQVIRLDRETLSADKTLILHAFENTDSVEKLYPHLQVKLIANANFLQRPSLRIADGIESLCATIAEASLTH